MLARKLLSEKFPFIVETKWQIDWFEVEKKFRAASRKNATTRLDFESFHCLVSMTWHFFNQMITFESFAV